MAKSIFREKAAPPGMDLIGSVLKETKQLWDTLAAYVSNTYPQVVQEWKFYGTAWGWCLVLSSRKKKLVYLTPSEGYFLCSFIFNNKDRELSRQSGFSEDILETIEAGKNNAAGHTFDIEVAGDQDLDLVKQLLHIKAAS
ncbi:DUF3788 domain-containing protein [Brucepastera parasyntrophica]|uniref:DUF3788 family protein n=1 Tax=Brucepastera parasyntrophica TaxID=2880008 RepID=UPI00210B77D1|nr:DUF3788 family protein [Brucepastera parasyntrophica]ULQ60426.1 DUF3788 domain-containing protein [Brucepastera parasyntrophica]